MSESRSSVFIQGLWDQREEAKFIAAEIRKRSKQRIASCAKVMSKLEKVGKEPHIHERSIYDSTDVAIMVRSSSQLKLIEEALKRNGIPYVIPKGGDNHSPNSSSPVGIFKGRHSKLLSMKPVKLITMHKAKGDEFDDVYLASWTEGVFPHPLSLSSNRVHEERRIAYVALTRARQRVVLTYSFVKRHSFFGPTGERKSVTQQVEPSRFLHDLMSVTGKSDLDNGQQSIEWSDSFGFKETVAGKDVPPEYRNSYKIPTGFTKNEIATNLPLSHKPLETAQKEKDGERDMDDDITALLSEIKFGLSRLFNRDRGACGKYRKEFRAILTEHGITRGNALVLTDDGKKELDEAVDALVRAPSTCLTTRALSRCTAEQLGLYLVYLLLHQDE